jgi:hypothetical protein
MHEEKVNVLGAKVFQRLLKCALYILRRMVGIPEFASNEDVGAGNTAFSNPLAYFSFISVDGCTVNVSVSCFESQLYCALDF